jgi:hypothetical protein
VRAGRRVMGFARGVGVISGVWSRSVDWIVEK